MIGVLLLTLWTLVFLFILYQIYKRIQYRTQEGFQDVYDPTDLVSFFQPFQIEEVCKVYTYVYPKLVQSESLNGSQRRSDEEARDAANKVLKAFIPGELLECPYEIPTEKTLDVVEQYINKLPDTFLATVYATLVYCTTNIQQSAAAMKQALQSAESARREGFVDVCTKEQAEAKEKLKQATQCTLEGDLTPEQKAQRELEQKERIQKKMKTLVDNYLTWRTDKIASLEASIKTLLPQWMTAKARKESIDKDVKEAGNDVPEEMSQKQEAADEVFDPLDTKLKEHQSILGNLNQSTSSLVKSCQDILPKLTALKSNLEQGNFSSKTLEPFEVYFQSPLR